MPRVKLRRPSPAFVLAAIALFVSLGGTGYAASRLTDGSGAAQAAKHTSKPKPLTKSQVNKLIAAYFKAHRGSLVGPKGDTGAAGARGADGRQGPAGPGAQQIAGSTISGSGTQPLATFGPWTLTLTCTASAPNATVTLTGPGTYAWTANIGTASSVANGSIGGGFQMTVNSGAQLAVDGFLQSGSTVEQLHLQIIAVNGGLFQSCSVVGDAIPTA